jgi:hypothetical protein
MVLSKSVLPGLIHKIIIIPAISDSITAREEK